MSKEYMREWRKRKKVEKSILNSDSEDNENGHDLFPVSNDVCNDSIEEMEVTSTYGPQSEDNHPLLTNTFSSEEKSDNSSTSSNKMDLNDDLSLWACRNALSRAAVTELLNILISHGHTELPKDARTLLQTPKIVPVEDKFGGQYTYLGIENQIRKKIGMNAINNQIIKLNLNIDGLPLFKSSNKNLWPILGCIVYNTNTNTTPFPIALFCGDGKLSDCTDFLKDFLTEYKELNENGLTVNENHYFCKINALVCDAPARQYLKCIKSHNGYYSCERCMIKGESIERRMIFDSIHEPPRLTESFKSLVYVGYQIGKSPLIDSSIYPIKDVPLDYMHLVLLGTVVRLLLFLKEGPKICKVSSKHLSEISEKLDSYRNKIPSELAR